MAGFTDQRQRLRNIVQKALDGCAYEASREEPERLLVIEARRSDNRRVTVRFRGVRDSEASEAPVAGAPMRLASVGSPSRLALIGLFIPVLRFPGEDYTRVRIEVGAAHLDIVCQDAEWWEDEAAPGAPEASAP
jgi:hypothetical protein